jgi:hypothetical protein
MLSVQTNCVAWKKNLRERKKMAEREEEKENKIKRKPKHLFACLLTKSMSVRQGMMAAPHS